MQISTSPLRPATPIGGNHMSAACVDERKVVFQRFNSSTINRIRNGKKQLPESCFQRVVFSTRIVNLDRVFRGQTWIHPRKCRPRAPASQSPLGPRAPNPKVTILKFKIRNPKRKIRTSKSKFQIPNPNINFKIPKLKPQPQQIEIRKENPQFQNPHPNRKPESQNPNFKSQFQGTKPESKNKIQNS